jgi:hypothetical protein
MCGSAYQLIYTNLFSSLKLIDFPRLWHAILRVRFMLSLNPQVFVPLPASRSSLCLPLAWAGNIS